MLINPDEDPLGLAMQLDAFGLADAAKEKYEDAIARGGSAGESAAYLKRRLDRRLARNTAHHLPWESVHLYQLAENDRQALTDPANWVNYLLGGRSQRDIFLDELTYIPSKTILYGSGASPESEEFTLFFLKKCFEEGISTVFILGDEWYRYSFDFISRTNRYCDLLIGICYSPHMELFGNVVQIPFGLGNTQYPSSSSGAPSKPASERQYYWSFIGDPNKSTRKAMLEEMTRYDGGFQHLASGWMAADALAPTRYRAILEDSLFAPCPAGWANVDSYRIWEALDAGCIPIVERRDFDYFASLCGPHPMPTLRHWSEVHTILEQYRDPYVAEQLRATCAAWWDNYRQTLRTKIGSTLDSL